MDNIMKAQEDTIILQNYDKWKEILLLNISTDKIERCERSDKKIVVRGIFVLCNGEITMFYKKDSELFFQTQGIKYCLQRDGCNVNFKRKGKSNLFWIELNKEAIFLHEYDSWRYDELNQSYIDFNDNMEENQDFYLFVYNVMQDKDWQSRIYV